MLLENEVVLTKMKILNSFDKLISLEDSVSTLSLSVSEHETPEPARAAEVSSVKSAPSGQESKDMDYLSAMFSDPQLPRLYKFESEDSGVEMPSGANSPSTPTGSEQSFVVHSRESSCDSGALTPPLPTQEPLLLLEAEGANGVEVSEIELLEETVIAGAMATGLTEVDGLEEGEDTECQFEEERSDSDVKRPGDGALRNPPEECVGVQHGEREAERRAVEEETRPRTESSNEADCDEPVMGADCDESLMGPEFKGAPLRKSTTSDSLDEYMEECCRLSEVRLRPIFTRFRPSAFVRDWPGGTGSERERDGCPCRYLPSYVYCRG